MCDYCFFCSKPIAGKKTEEHIIPNSLLKKLAIKEQILKGQGKFLYSRIKVPAHSVCNSEFGSRYESKIMSILDNPNKLLEEILQDEDTIDIEYPPSDRSTSLITTWLSKIYYGLFYNDYLKVKDPDWTEVYREIIDSDNFRLIQKSYQGNYGFSLPSSLFAFKANDEDFDLQTFVNPQAILLKIKDLVLILCLGDGYLTKAYLRSESLQMLRQHLSSLEKANQNLPLHLIALAEILAIRISIPKSPKFIYSDGIMFNMSFNTFVKDPQLFYKIDDEVLRHSKKDVYDSILQARTPSH